MPARKRKQPITKEENSILSYYRRPKKQLLCTEENDPVPSTSKNTAENKSSGSKKKSDTHKPAATRKGKNKITEKESKPGGSKKKSDTDKPAPTRKGKKKITEQESESERSKKKSDSKKSPPTREGNDKKSDPEKLAPTCKHRTKPINDQKNTFLSSLDERLSLCSDLNGSIASTSKNVNYQSNDIVRCKLVFLSPKSIEFENYVITPISNLDIMWKYLDMILTGTWLRIKDFQLDNNYCHYLFPTSFYTLHNNFIKIDRLANNDEIEIPKKSRSKPQVKYKIEKIYCPPHINYTSISNELGNDDSYNESPEEDIGYGNIESIEMNQ